MRAAQAVKLANGEGLRDSEDIGEIRKEIKRNFDEKRLLRRVGVAYRELIGSLYESWTIGIGKVYK